MGNEHATASTGREVERRAAEPTPYNADPKEMTEAHRAAEAYKNDPWNGPPYQPLRDVDPDKAWDALKEAGSDVFETVRNLGERLPGWPDDRPMVSDVEEQPYDDGTEYA